jgi:hypothetical protein
LLTSTSIAAEALDSGPPAASAEARLVTSMFHDEQVVRVAHRVGDGFRVAAGRGD